MADPGEDLDLKCCHRWQRRAILGMRFFHHKTRKARFAIGVPVILLVQIGVVCLVQWAMK